MDSPSSSASNTSSDLSKSVVPRVYARGELAVVIATVVIAIAALLNLCATIYLGFTTREYVEATKSYVQISENTFRADNRPYVGVSYVGPPSAKPNGTVVFKPGMDVRRFGGVLKFPFVIAYKNYGSIPARDVKIKYSSFVNGDLQRMMNIPREPSSLFPGQETSISNELESNRLQSILDGTSVFEIQIEIEYKGIISESYVTREKARYDSICPCYMKQSSDFQ